MQGRHPYHRGAPCHLQKWAQEVPYPQAHAHCGKPGGLTVLPLTEPELPPSGPAPGPGEHTGVLCTHLPPLPESLADDPMAPSLTKMNATWSAPGRERTRLPTDVHGLV